MNESRKREAMTQRITVCWCVSGQWRVAGRSVAVGVTGVSVSLLHAKSPRSVSNSQPALSALRDNSIYFNDQRQKIGSLPSLVLKKR